MKAAVFGEIGSPLSIEEVTVDQPGPREVLIRTAAAGLCHSDLHAIEGKELWPMPTVLGHEAAGTVEKVGRDVAYVQRGDRVLTCVSVFCGTCEYCLTGHPSLCHAPELERGPDGPGRLSQPHGQIHQFLNVSAFAEQLLVHENAVMKIPDDMPFDRAALIGCGVITGMGAVFNTARLEPGSTTAVIGCGGIGLNCVQGAALAGASRVIAVDRVPRKLELARQFGATHTVYASGDDPVGQVIELSDGGVQYSFEAVGSKTTIEQAFAMLRPGGTATVIGVVETDTTIELSPIDLLMERRIQGSALGSNRFRVDIPRYVDLYLQGRLKLDELISERIRLDQVNEAFDQFESGKSARTVIVFD